MPAACPSGESSISCLLGTPHSCTLPGALKAELAIPAAGSAGQHFLVSLTATLKSPEVPGLAAGTCTVVVAKAGRTGAAQPSHGSAASSAPPATQATAPQGGVASPARPGEHAGAVSAVGAPLPARRMLPPHTAAPGLKLPKVTPGQSGSPSPAAARPVPVPGLIPLSGGQLGMQAGTLGLLVIALVVTLSRVSGRRLLPGRLPIRFLQCLPGASGAPVLALARHLKTDLLGGRSAAEDRR